MISKIINLCPTGTIATKENSLAPIYYSEVIDEVLACYELGISLVHLHARDQNGENTYRKESFQKIINEIKKYAPDLAICVSLSGRYFNDKILRGEVLSLYPDLASLTMSSMNFPKNASINDPETILWLIEEMNLYGVHPEIECFDTGMLNYTNYLIKNEILKEPLYINVILGNLFNAGADIATISSIINNLPKNSKICFGGIGPVQLKSNMLGLMEVDGIRIGLEDNFYYQNKDKTTNIQLLRRIHRIMDELGFQNMSTLEFKKLGYENRKIKDFGIK